MIYGSCDYTAKIATFEDGEKFMSDSGGLKRGLDSLNGYQKIE